MEASESMIRKHRKRGRQRLAVSVQVTRFPLGLWDWAAGDLGKLCVCVCVCACVLLVAQSCWTLCDPMVCPRNSLGKDTGVGCHMRVFFSLKGWATAFVNFWRVGGALSQSRNHSYGISECLEFRILVAEY